MKIEIKIDEGCTETKIIVVTSKVTEEVNEIVKRLSSEQPQMIAAFKDDQATMLDPTQIYRVYASEGKVYAETESSTFLLRLRLYEAEQRLAKCSFVRISNGEIVNLKKVKGFDLNFVGTICVSLERNRYLCFKAICCKNQTTVRVMRWKMKKKILMRGLFGLPTGIAIGFVITLIISICIGNGSFYPVTPELIDATGNELNAVILQTVLCAIMGAGFAAASIIWELDSWSLAKQSGIYFMIISVIMLPIAYFTNWMKHTALGVLSYVAIFVAIFVVVWLSQYLLWKRKIKQMNTLVSKDQ